MSLRNRVAKTGLPSHGRIQTRFLRQSDPWEACRSLRRADGPAIAAGESLSGYPRGLGVCAASRPGTNHRADLAPSGSIGGEGTVGPARTMLTTRGSFCRAAFHPHGRCPPHALRCILGVWAERQ